MGQPISVIKGLVCPVRDGRFDFLEVEMTGGIGIPPLDSDIDVSILFSEARV